MYETTFCLFLGGNSSSSCGFTHSSTNSVRKVKYSPQQKQWEPPACLHCHLSLLCPSASLGGWASVADPLTTAGETVLGSPAPLGHVHMPRSHLRCIAELFAPIDSPFVTSLLLTSCSSSLLCIVHLACASTLRWHSIRNQPARWPALGQLC